MSRFRKVAAIAVFVSMAYAASVFAVTVRPVSVARSHWDQLEAFPESFGLRGSAIAARRVEAASQKAEEANTGGSQTQELYGHEDSDWDDWSVSFVEGRLLESSLLEKNSMGSSTSCSVSFSDGYSVSPVVEVKGGGTGHNTATAVFVDESARYWLHGWQKGIRVPSSFRFGTEGTDGDYADIHPPVDTGRHTYTVVLYKGSLEPGPLLSSLQGTAWSHRKRAVGSLLAIVDDFRVRNEGMPVEELCRCSVLVSHEDIAQ